MLFSWFVLAWVGAAVALAAVVVFRTRRQRRLEDAATARVWPVLSGLSLVAAAFEFGGGPSVAGVGFVLLGIWWCVIGVRARRRLHSH